MQSDGDQALTGVVVIGRNEGLRLQRCLQSLQAGARPIVYVDSGSTDGSPAWAKAQGVTVLALDMTRPFTAARARNEGWRLLLSRWPGLQWVQFVDGDCEVRAGWVEAAQDFMAGHPEVAVACGRRRERAPEASIYNLLCDIEWDTPVGEALACGGDALFRAQALVAVQGYRDGLIAGEEPELCVRLRAQGWKVWRLDVEMTWHDAAMDRFGQWWRRNVRSGHAFAEGASLHGRSPERHFVAETRRAVLWGAVLPVLTLLLTIGWSPGWACLAMLYPLQVLRLRRRFRHQRTPAPTAQAFFLTLGRLPEAWGVLKYWRGRWQQQPSALIEYK